MHVYLWPLYKGKWMETQSHQHCSCWYADASARSSRPWPASMLTQYLATLPNQFHISPKTFNVLFFWDWRVDINKIFADMYNVFSVLVATLLQPSVPGHTKTGHVSAGKQWCTVSCRAVWGWATTVILHSQSGAHHFLWFYLRLPLMSVLADFHLIGVIHWFAWVIWLV